MAGVEIEMEDFGRTEDDIEDEDEDEDEEEDEEEEEDEDDAEGNDAETSFIITPADNTDVFTTNGLDLDHQNIAGAANDYYNMLWEDQGLKPQVPDLSKFVVDGKGRLRMRGRPDINLINEKTGRPNKLTYIARKKGGRAIVIEDLGFSNWTPEM